MIICVICKDTGEKRFLAKTTLIRGTEFDLLECLQCGVFFLNPMPTQQELARFYSLAYCNFSPKHDEAKGIIYARRLSKWRQRGRFLDIGCASGHFIHSLRTNSQWEVVGVDFGDAAVRYARDTLGLNIRQGDLGGTSFSDQHFDFVHVNNVLEHVINPLAFLKECRRIIKPDGRMYLSVPNGYNDTRNMIDFYASEGTAARTVDGHLFFFPRRVLQRMLTNAGFAIDKAKTGSIKRGLRNVGILPRKKNWKTIYHIESLREGADAGGIDARADEGKPDFYFQYRYYMSNLNNLFGLHDFGLDFMFDLRPIP